MNKLDRMELARKRQLNHKDECPADNWDADPDTCTCGVTAIYDAVRVNCARLVEGKQV